MQAVILAAGLGKRLQPVTRDRSKAMVPTLGRPLVERAMMPYAANGIRDFILVVRADDEEIRRHFLPDEAIRLVVQNEQLGMADALAAASHLIDGPFSVSACDSLVSAEHVGEILRAVDGADAVLSLLDVEGGLVARSASVELDGIRVRRIVEKPAPGEAPSNTVSLPHYVFSPAVLELLPELQPSPRGEYEIQEAIQAAIDRGSRVVGVWAGSRFQVSSPEDLLALTRTLLKDTSVSAHINLGRVGRSTKLTEPLRVDDGVLIGDGCEIGPEVYLESGCRIGHGAVVRRAIVLRGGRVADGETVENRVIA
jgi:bifunctional UDP-N-acetylglucosamine pyrophosphorylase/glucosamine-1-phosphate N-acetyltransferase